MIEDGDNDVFGQSVSKTAASPTKFIPAGYVVFEEIRGDLNRDNEADYVFIIKGTDRKKIVKHEYLGELAVRACLSYTRFP